MNVYPKFAENHKRKGQIICTSTHSCSCTDTAGWFIERTPVKLLCCASWGQRRVWCSSKNRRTSDLWRSDADACNSTFWLTGTNRSSTELWWSKWKQFLRVRCVQARGPKMVGRRGGTFEEKSDLQEDEYAVSGEIMSLSHQMLKLGLNLWNSFFLLIPGMLSYFERLWNLVCLCTRKVYYLAVCCNIELVVFWFVLLHYSSTSSVVSVHCLLTLCCKVNMKHTIIRANLSWSHTTAESPDQKHHEEK